MKRLKINLDLDGVVANWEDTAMELLGASKDKYIPILKEGGDLENYFPNQWDILDSKADEFWTKLEKLPWAEDLIDLGLKYGDVSFLTSGGNVYKRPQGAGGAAMGKSIWVAEKFREYEIPLIVTRDKHFCAFSESILVDDRLKNIEKFEQYGGNGFHFPQIYKILDGEIPIQKVLGDLERKLQSLSSFDPFKSDFGMVA